MRTTLPEKNPVASHLRVGPDTTVRCVFIHANDRIIPLPVLDLCNIFVSDILKVLSEHGLETKVMLTCGTKPLGCHHNCSLAEYGVAFDSCIFVTPSDALPGGTKVAIEHTTKPSQPFIAGAHKPQKALSSTKFVKGRQKPGAAPIMVATRTPSRADAKFFGPVRCCWVSGYDSTTDESELTAMLPRLPFATERVVIPTPNLRLPFAFVVWGEPVEVPEKHNGLTFHNERPFRWTGTHLVMADQHGDDFVLFGVGQLPFLKSKLLEDTKNTTKSVKSAVKSTTTFFIGLLDRLTDVVATFQPPMNLMMRKICKSAALALRLVGATTEVLDGIVSIAHAVLAIHACQVPKAAFKLGEETVKDLRTALELLDYLVRCQDLDGATRLQQQIRDSLKARIAELDESLGSMHDRIRTLQERKDTRAGILIELILDVIACAACPSPLVIASVLRFAAQYELDYRVTWLLRAYEKLEVKIRALQSLSFDLGQHSTLPSGAFCELEVEIPEAIAKLSSIAADGWQPPESCRIEHIKEVGKELWDKLCKLWDNMWVLVKAGAAKLEEVWCQFKRDPWETTKKAVDVAIVTPAKAVYKAMSGFLIRAWRDPKGVSLAIWRSITNSVRNLWNGVTEGVTSIIESLCDASVCVGAAVADLACSAASHVSSALRLFIKKYEDSKLCSPPV